MKKLLVSYSNCQGSGTIHFIRKSRLSDVFEFKHHNNYKIALKEESAEDLLMDARKADVFFYQPLHAIKYFELSTEEMIDSIVPKSALKLSHGYGFNHGFFPLVKHGDQWHTSEEVKRLARDNPEQLRQRYEQDTLRFDCRVRFTACLEEQRRREERDKIDICMADWVQEMYQWQHLFISENHPASAYFAELARRVVRAVTGEVTKIPFSSNNEAGLPCSTPVHPAVVRELALNYSAEDSAVEYFRNHIDKFVQDSTPQ